MWALGNVAGDSAKCRDIVHAHGALFPILQLFNGNPRLSLLRTVTWSLSNFCRGEPNFEHVWRSSLWWSTSYICCLTTDGWLVLWSSRWSQHFWFCDNSFTLKTRQSLLMPAGQCLTCVVVMMTTPGSKLWLKLEHALDLLSSLGKDFLFILTLDFSLRNINTDSDAQAAKKWFSHPSPSVLVPSLLVVGSIAAGDEVHTQVFFLSSIQYQLLLYYISMSLCRQDNKSWKNGA